MLTICGVPPPLFQFTRAFQPGYLRKALLPLGDQKYWRLADLLAIKSLVCWFKWIHIIWIRWLLNCTELCPMKSSVSVPFQIPSLLNMLAIYAQYLYICKLLIKIGSLTEILCTLNLRVNSIEHNGTSEQMYLFIFSQRLLKTTTTQVWLVANQGQLFFHYYKHLLGQWRMPLLITWLYTYSSSPFSLFEMSELQEENRFPVFLKFEKK